VDTPVSIGETPPFEPSLDIWTSIFFVVSIFGLFFLKGRHRLMFCLAIPVMILGFFQLSSNQWIVVASMSVYLILSTNLWNQHKKQTSRKIANS